MGAGGRSGADGRDKTGGKSRGFGADRRSRAPTGRTDGLHEEGWERGAEGGGAEQMAGQIHRRRAGTDAGEAASPRDHRGPRRGPPGPRPEDLLPPPSSPLLGPGAGGARPIRRRGRTRGGAATRGHEAGAHLAPAAAARPPAARAGGSRRPRSPAARSGAAPRRDREESPPPPPPPSSAPPAAAPPPGHAPSASAPPSPAH